MTDQNNIRNMQNVIFRMQICQFHILLFWLGLSKQIHKKRRR